MTQECGQERRGSLRGQARESLFLSWIWSCNRELLRKGKSNESEERGVKEIGLSRTCDQGVRNAPTGNRITRSHLRLHPGGRVGNGGFRHHQRREHKRKETDCDRSQRGGVGEGERGGVEVEERWKREMKVKVKRSGKRLGCRGVRRRGREVPGTREFGGKVGEAGGTGYL